MNVNLSVIFHSFQVDYMIRYASFILYYYHNVFYGYPIGCIPNYSIPDILSNLALTIFY